MQQYTNKYSIWMTDEPIQKTIFRCCCINTS